MEQKIVFDKKKVLTPFTKEEARQYINKKVWVGDNPVELKHRVEKEKPTVLLEIKDISGTNFPFVNADNIYRYLYPAPEPTYEELQAEWLKDNPLKFGDIVKIISKWEKCEKWEEGFRYPMGGLELGDELKVDTIYGFGISVYAGMGLGTVPFFAIEKVKEPTRETVSLKLIKDEIGRYIVITSKGDEVTGSRLGSINSKLGEPLTVTVEFKLTEEEI